MNTDDYKERQIERDLFFDRNVKSGLVKCSDVKQYAADQQATYDEETGQILYGIDTNLRVFGVSDGTCNQTNPLLYTNRYKCGLGTAGGNPCYPDTLNYKFDKIYKQPNVDNKTVENFGNVSFMGQNMKTTEIVIAVLIVILLIMLCCCN